VRDDRARAATEALAERIARHAEREVAERLSGGKASVDSETAHKIAADVARRREREAK
jgi:hypothetical protein